MYRRNLLKGLVAAVTLQGTLAGPPVRAATRQAMRRVRPADAAWPSAAKWQQLNDAVGGNIVIAVQPDVSQRAKSEPNGAACLDAVKNYIRNPFYIGDQPAGTQVSGWLDACGHRAPSVYAVKAHSTADAVAAVNFARENNLRLVVKATGHSYQGTSNAADFAG